MTTTLAEAPLNTPMTCVSADASPELRRRLAELGIRPGAHVRLLGRTSGGGRVVQVGGASIAIGKQVLRGIVASTDQAA